jgi:hypothetical protein
MDTCNDCQRVLTSDNIAACEDYKVCACYLCIKCAEKLEANTAAVARI